MLYEDEQIKVMRTGTDYDFIATIENKTDRTVTVTAGNDSEPFEQFEVEPHNWVGILADADGYRTLEQIKSGNFEVIE